jgi:hypothetical protein
VLAYNQRLVSVVKMATMLEGNTTKSSVLLCFFCGQNYSMYRIFTQKYFLFTVGSVCHVKRSTAGLRNSLKDVRKSQMMPDQVALLRLRQKQLYSGTTVQSVQCCGFRLTGKVMGEAYQKLVEDMSRNKCFFPDSNFTCFSDIKGGT